MAAAMVMDVSVESLIAYIGHDGSEIVFPDLPGPACRAGFDIQEIIDAAWSMGWSVTPIEARPRVTPDGTHVRDLFSENKIALRMKHYFKDNNGVVVGERLFGERRWWHAIAWDHVTRMWYDPRGPILPFETPPIAIATFWIFSKR